MLLKQFVQNVGQKSASKMVFKKGVKNSVIKGRQQILLKML
jgi:hypothetical protein